MTHAPLQHDGRKTVVAAKGYQRKLACRKARAHAQRRAKCTQRRYNRPGWQTANDVRFEVLENGPQPVRDPKPMARPEIHDTVARILDPLPRGRLLDIPAGEGALALRLAEAGFQVRACDFYPELFLPPRIEIRFGDLSGTLRYRDAEFDYVVCIEGLEHVENPHQSIREFSRVLTPGGHLLVSVPNILNIEERLKWLFFGYTSHFKPISQQHLDMRRKQVGGNHLPVALHINPVPYTELRYTLENCGFELLATHRDRRKSRMWMYWPLVALIRGIGWFTSSEKRRERWTDELQSDAVLLGGNTLILHARRK